MRIQALEAELRSANKRATSLQRQLELLEGRWWICCGLCRPVCALLGYTSSLHTAHKTAHNTHASAAESARLAEAAASATGKADAQSAAAVTSREEATSARRAGEALRQQLDAANAQVSAWQASTWMPP